MKKTEPKRPIKVERDSARFQADVQALSKQFPGILSDVEKCLRGTILPALERDPVFPHRQGGGTPLVLSVYHVRISNSSGASGDRGGFRMRYHWNREKRFVTLLSISLRRDDASLPRKAVKKLLSAAKTPPR